MKETCKDWPSRRAVMAGLLVATVVVSGGCARRAYGPVPVEGVVTGKHQVNAPGNSSEYPTKGKPRYFLWMRTNDGPAFVEVTEEVFQAVTEGDQVCINCDAKGQ